MARPIKKGLDYFPLDVHLNEKWEIVEAKFGLEGFAILIKLLQKIYDKGYYLKLDNYIPLLISKKFGISEEKLKEIIVFSTEIGFFDPETWVKEEVITSKGIQMRYITGTVGRKKVEMEEKYLLLDDKLPNNVKLKANKCEKIVSGGLTPVSGGLTPVSGVISTHTTLHETTLKETTLHNDEKCDINEKENRSSSIPFKKGSPPPPGDPEPTLDPSEAETIHDETLIEHTFRLANEKAIDKILGVWDDCFPQHFKTYGEKGKDKVIQVLEANKSLLNIDEFIFKIKIYKSDHPEIKIPKPWEVIKQ